MDTGETGEYKLMHSPGEVRGAPEKEENHYELAGGLLL
jgi:hypothetical protein